MKMIITTEMVNKFNEILFEEGSIFRLKKSPETQSITITLKDDPYLKDCSLVYPNQQFYDKLEKFFAEKYNITELGYNNTTTTFWKFV